MIEIKDLKKTCGTVPVANGISAKLKNSGVYGILDAREQSRHAFLSLLAGAMTPDRGTIFINGFDTVKETAKVSRCIGYMPKNLTPYPDMTPEEYLILIAEARNLDYEDGMRAVNALLDDAELRGRKRSLCACLSTAEKKRLCLAQTGLGNPEILILDEPTDGLDERNAEDILDRIEAFAAQNKTILLGSADPNLLRSICDKILLLSNGNLIGVYTANDAALDAYCEVLAPTEQADEASSDESADQPLTDDGADTPTDNSESNNEK